MRLKLTLLLATVLVSLHAIAQNGKIAGKIAGENNKPLSGATIEVFAKGIRVATTTSRQDGNYEMTVKNGTYIVTAKYASFQAKKRDRVKVLNGITTTVNFSFTSVNQLPAVAEDIKVKEQHPIKRRRGEESISDKDTYQWTPQAHGSNIGYSKSSPGDVMGVSSGVSEVVYYNPSREEYKKVAENDYMNVKANPLSTMSIDVDRASYSNVRRFIQDGQRPPEDAVRVEEMINYFSYNYPAPTNDDPIAINTEYTTCPWNKEHKLLRIGMQAKKISYEKLPSSNLVFLIDVSGSMESSDKLPLLISSMKLLVNNLRSEDKVSIVTYAGAAGLVLPSTPGSKKEKIIDALERLSAGGSTAGGQGILLAYKVAQENFITGGNNRIILATDGDFNVGVSADNELESLIIKEREKGIFLSCLGFGTGNYKDSKMEMLADKGNGNYNYIDNIDEGKKTLVNEFGGTLFTVAKDVKAQIEFNPAKVQSYRLVGYENRMLNAEDFKDDKKDAGELGAGHTVTFIYEIVPFGTKSKDVRKVDDLKYQDKEPSPDDYTDELATVKFRYKKPDADKSKEMAYVVKDRTLDMQQASEDTKFAYSVALFGMLLKNSKFKGEGTIEEVLALAKNNKGEDEDGYRAEFVKLVKNVRDDIKISQK